MESDGSCHSISILFVCMGNICRSPMADFYFKNLVQKLGISNLFKIYSAAASDDPLKNDMCVGTKKELEKHHIPYHKRPAVKLTKNHLLSYNYIICMDKKIEDLVIKLGGEEVKNKVFKLLDFSDTPMDIVDPAETNDFVRTYKEVSKGCDALSNYLIYKYKIKTYKSTFVA